MGVPAKRQEVTKQDMLRQHRSEAYARSVDTARGDSARRGISNVNSEKQRSLIESTVGESEDLRAARVRA